MRMGIPASGDHVTIPKYLLDLMGTPVSSYGDPVKCIVQSSSFYMGEFQSMTLRVMDSDVVVSLTPKAYEAMLLASKVA